MPADPSLSSLPPEMVEAIVGAYGGDEGDTTPARIAAALAPLLAERDAEKDAAIARLQAGYRSLDADWGRSQAEARRLREALESARARFESVQGQLDDPDEALDLASLGIRDIDAALSASPDAEGAEYNGRDITPRPPVSVPEQEEGRYGRNFREAMDHIRSLPPSERAAASNRAASSSSSERGEVSCGLCGGTRSVPDGEGLKVACPCSSSEEGERAGAADAIGLIYDALHAERFAEPDADGMRERAAIVFATLCENWLRERLTSDEAVKAAVAASMPRLWSPERRAEIAAAALTTVAAALLNDTKETRCDSAS